MIFYNLLKITSHYFLLLFKSRSSIQIQRTGGTILALENQNSYKSLWKRPVFIAPIRPASQSIKLADPAYASIADLRMQLTRASKAWDIDSFNHASHDGNASICRQGIFDPHLTLHDFINAESKFSPCSSCAINRAKFISRQAYKNLRAILENIFIERFIYFDLVLLLTFLLLNFWYLLMTTAITLKPIVFSET